MKTHHSLRLLFVESINTTCTLKAIHGVLGIMQLVVQVSGCMQIQQLYRNQIIYMYRIFTHAFFVILRNVQ